MVGASNQYFSMPCQKTQETVCGDRFPLGVSPWKASIGYRNIGGNVSRSLVSRRFGVLAEIRYFEPVSFVPAECFGEDYRQNWIVGVPDGI